MCMSESEECGPDWNWRSIRRSPCAPHAAVRSAGENPQRQVRISRATEGWLRREKVARVNAKSTFTPWHPWAWVLSHTHWGQRSEHDPCLCSIDHLRQLLMALLRNLRQDHRANAHAYVAASVELRVVPDSDLVHCRIRPRKMTTTHPQKRIPQLSAVCDRCSKLWNFSCPCLHCPPHPLPIVCDALAPYPQPPPSVAR